MLPSDPACRPRSPMPGLALVVAAAGTLLLLLQRATEGLYGYDGYFHIQYARLIRLEGISRSFPWWQETFLRDHWADKDFLYHLLLIPFTFGDLVAGGKAAAVVFGAASIGIIFLTLHRLRVPWPSLWTLGLVASSTAFLYRLGFTRPLVLAVALAVAGTGAILLGRTRWSFVLAALYPHLHISFHLLPCVALLHDLHRGPDPATGRRSFRVSWWTLAGAATGALLSPFVPNNLRLWWVQNVRVLGMAWAGPEELRLGLEIQPGTSSQLLITTVGVFIALAAAVYMMARSRNRPSPESLTLLVISSGFLALSMMSRRFIEFWAPFTFFLAAVVVRDRLQERPAGAPRRLVRGTAAAAVATGAALMVWSAISAREYIGKDQGLNYAGASRWMGEKIPAGETVFHLDWDDFPQLFFFNPQLHYLVGLDPTFMYLTSAERWRLWSDVAHGNVEDIYTPIRTTFSSRWVLAIPEAEEFMKAARRDPRFLIGYEDDSATVFALQDGYTFVSDWRLTGWYPDPARRLFDMAIGPEPAGRLAGSAVAPVGRAAQGIDYHAGGGFVDMAAGMGLTVAAEGACGVAEADLPAEGTQEVLLGMTTDDEFRLYLNGEEVAAVSPLRNPPPGRPGGPDASLDEFLEASSHLPEKRYRAVLERGGNALSVKVCRVGEDFGFYLRASRGDGTPVAGLAAPGPAGP